ncbi:MAG: rod shape-determining protein [Marinitoga sp. 4572_148]|nr:MAG: rod shape-determining protein [Marinitoga sp. 4572_148]
MRSNIGIDLGTANTLVYVKGKGIVVNEPSVIAIEKDTKEILTVGKEAKKMIGKTPANIIAIRPLKDGVIADYNTALAMLKYFINASVGSFTFFKPTVVVGVPTDATEVERNALYKATLDAGAGKAFLIEEIRIAGDELDEAIISYVKDKAGLLIGERTAEKIKKKIGNTWPNEEYDNEEIEIIGRDILSGLPKNILLKGYEIREAISNPVSKIVEQIKITVEETPPELLTDIVMKGIYLSGGGALLKGLKELIENETKIKVIVAEDPLTAVARGAGMVLDKIKILENLAKLQK